MRLLQNQPNVVTLANGGFVYCFSYTTLVAIAHCGEVLVTDQYHSRTTTRHINNFAIDHRGREIYGTWNEHITEVSPAQLMSVSDRRREDREEVFFLLVKAYSNGNNTPQQKRSK